MALVSDSCAGRTEGSEDIARISSAKLGGNAARVNSTMEASKGFSQSAIPKSGTARIIPVVTGPRAYQVGCPSERVVQLPRDTDYTLEGVRLTGIVSQSNGGYGERLYAILENGQAEPLNWDYFQFKRTARQAAEGAKGTAVNLSLIHI